MTALLAALGSVAAQPIVSISNVTPTDTAVDPDDASAFYSLESDGDIATHAGDIGDWITPKAAAGANYEARATVTSGSLSSGSSASGSWLALSTTRTWYRNRSSLGTSACTLTVEIRRASDSVVLSTATVTLTATVES